MGAASDGGRDLAQVDRASESLHRGGIGLPRPARRRGNVMRPNIRPLYTSAKLAGFARTVQAITVDAPSASKDHWYRGELLATGARTEAPAGSSPTPTHETP